MTSKSALRGFAGELIRLGDTTYDAHREIWNAMVDRHPALIARCGSATDDAYLARGVPAGGPDPDWALMPGGGFQPYGGAVAEVGEDDSAFSHRRTLVEFFGGATWADPDENTVRIGAARACGAALEPFSIGTYVNVISDPGEGGVGRAYGSTTLARLAELKRVYDPENVFHLNQNIRPAASS